MPLRYIEADIPEGSRAEVEAMLAREQIIGFRLEEDGKKWLRLRLVVESDQAAGVLDRFEERFGHVEGFQMILLAVEARIPRPEASAPEEKPEEKEPEPEAPPKKPSISREELYADVEAGARPSNGFLALVALSTIVAAIAILRNNVAVLIGAMVIAPLLGPNVALALSTTLGDGPLARKSLRSLITGIALALLISILWGLIQPVTPGTPGVSERILAGPGDIGLALASGCAGVLAYTSGASASLVGVMVAVALLPPLVTAGMLFGGGYMAEAGGAFAIFLINTICINLAGILTFLFQGIRPLSWWEQKKAKRASWRALAVWAVLLTLLFLLIMLKV